MRRAIEDCKLYRSITVSFFTRHDGRLVASDDLSPFLSVSLEAYLLDCAGVEALMQHCAFRIVAAGLECYC